MILHQSRRKNFKPITSDMLTALEHELVGIHWNSHEQCWSVVAFKSRNTVGKLIGHIDSISIAEISFKVDLSKKSKAIEKGKKDRHTYIVGHVTNRPMKENKGKFFYQPQDNGEPFKDAQGGSLVGNNAYFGRDGRVYKFY